MRAITVVLFTASSVLDSVLEASTHSEAAVSVEMTSMLEIFFILYNVETNTRICQISTAKREE